MKRSLLYQLGSDSGMDLGDWVKEVGLAEELGVDTVWCLPGLDEAGAYDVDVAALWLSALTSSTQRIRLGWGLPGMLPPSLPPIRIAESAAALDQSSKGRLDLALLPNQRADSEHAHWDEGLRMLVRMWSASKFSWDSPRFNVPAVDVLPKPVQSPHPPVALVGWADEQARAAGRAGLGYLDVSGAQASDLEVHRDAYQAGRAEAGVDVLVSHAAFAAAIEYDGAEVCQERLRECEALGVDELILRASLAPTLPEERRERLRVLAGEPVESH